MRFSPRFLFHLIIQFHLLRKRGLLAHTSAAFLKNCCIEKLFSCLRLVVCSQDCLILMWCFTWNILKLLLGKPPETGSARLGHIPSLPGNRNCPWNLISHYNLSIFKAIAILCGSLLDFCSISLYNFICFANVGYSPTPRQHFCKIAAPKNFLFACSSFFETILLEKPPESGSAKLGHIPSLPWKSQLPLKPYLSLQPLYF